ncbi:MAG TPA: hypothetical protein VM287_03830 [Egibacteraceae bacterium]|nr:hypothetical protein [Egibacteraceae bacterium]
MIDVRRLHRGFGGMPPERDANRDITVTFEIRGGTPPDAAMREECRDLPKEAIEAITV